MKPPAEIHRDRPGKAGFLFQFLNYWYNENFLTIWYTVTMNGKAADEGGDWDAENDVSLCE